MYTNLEWPEGTLLERRAIFVYESTRLQAAAINAPIVQEPWSQRDHKFREQFLDIIEKQCGVERFRSAEEAHNSWWEKYKEMGWVYGPERNPVMKIHPDMVPFAELEWRERIKDAVFIAFCAIARKWIVDEDPGDDEAGDDYGNGYQAGIRDAQMEVIKAVGELDGARPVELFGIRRPYEQLHQ